MTRRFARRSTALVAAAALAVAGLAPAPARADDDLKRFLAGAAGLVILYSVLQAGRGAGAAPDRHVRPHPYPPRQRPIALPARCAVEVVSRGRGRHPDTLYGARCLERSGFDTRTLPRQCRVTLRSDGGSRAAFDGQCLRLWDSRADRDRHRGW